MKSRLWLLSPCLILLSCVLSGCSGVSLGPQVRTEYVVLHAGRPLQVLENKTLKGRVLDGTGDAVDQDVGGWVAMPMDHWEAVKRNLKD
jgi:flagellar biosynthesis/type III secretory pathway ATPase